MILLYSPLRPEHIVICYIGAFIYLLYTFDTEGKNIAGTRYYRHAAFWTYCIDASTDSYIPFVTIHLLIC